MKRIIIILLAAILAVSCGKSDREIRYTADAEIKLRETEGFGAKIESHEFENGEGVITFDNPITAIPNRAFEICGLTSITIPDSVTSIGDCAFAGCSLLTSITIPDSVTLIGDSAFYHCDGLTSITIPDSVTSIGERAFRSCRNLTNITIPDSVTSIGEAAFTWCSSLTSVTIPNSVTSIRKATFHGCTSLTSVTIPDSVTSIGYEAFYNCKSLTSVTIPNSVTNIESWAFAGCSSLASVWCKATIPPTGGYKMFNDNASNFTIYVPEESVLEYMVVDRWVEYDSYILSDKFLAIP